MDVSPWVWGLTIAGILAVISADLFLIHRKDTREFDTKRAGFWSTVYISLAVVFGLVVWFVWGGEYSAQYFGGFVTEKSLSVDNLFVFMVLLARFAVPKHSQHTVLMAGIVIALVLRGIFIAVGAAAISTFTWVFFIFGAILIWTAWGLAKDEDEDDIDENFLLRWAKKVIPTSDSFDGNKMITRVNGKRMATPLLIVMIAIGTTDVLFALDSIPAIFGLTTEPYLVFTANAFALMGLVQLYFLLDGLAARLVYLNKGLAFILGFIGLKLVFHALHEYGVNWAPDIPTWLSLSVIIGTLVAVTVASLAVPQKKAATAGADKDAQVKGGADAQDAEALENGRP